MVDCLSPPTAAVGMPNVTGPGQGVGQLRRESSDRHGYGNCRWMWRPCLGSSGQSEGAQGHRGAAQWRSHGRSAEAAWQAPRPRVHRQGESGRAAQHGSLVQGLEAAGIENFCWHDLRHTWASWHVQGGTPLHVLQELGGWFSHSMVQRYAHLAADHLAPWAERLGNRGTNPSQSEVAAQRTTACVLQAVDSSK
jgi:Phage integrase family